MRHKIGSKRKNCELKIVTNAFLLRQLRDSHDRTRWILMSGQLHVHDGNVGVSTTVITFHLTDIFLAIFMVICPMEYVDDVKKLKTVSTL